MMKAPRADEFAAPLTFRAALTIHQFVVTLLTLADYKISLSHFSSPFSRAFSRPWKSTLQASRQQLH
jgi:hypothetical protein